MTVRENDLVVVWEAESVTRMVKLAMVVEVGVPEIAPVEVLRVSPAGSVPAETAQVYPGVPPTAEIWVE